MKMSFAFVVPLLRLFLLSDEGEVISSELRGLSVRLRLFVLTLMLALGEDGVAEELSELVLVGEATLESVPLSLSFLPKTRPRKPPCAEVLRSMLLASLTE